MEGKKSYHFATLTSHTDLSVSFVRIYMFIAYSKLTNISVSTMNRIGCGTMHFFFIIVLFAIAIKFGANASLLKPQVASKIDVLRRDYLTVERNLWHFIANRQSNLDTAYLLEQIHFRHEAFLKSDFHLRNVPLSYYDTRHTNLLDAIHTVNNAADDMLKNHLHSDSKDFNQGESLQSAQQLSHLIKEIDIICNETGLTDFFTEIRNVSVPFACVIRCICLSQICAISKDFH